MVKTALVATEWELGKKILDALDDAKLSIKVAMWLYPQEHEDRRYVLAGKSLDSAGQFGAYRLVHNAVEKAGISYERTSTLMILDMNDLFIKDLRSIFGKSKSVEGTRLGMQTIGNRFVEDGLVYRVK